MLKKLFIVLFAVLMLMSAMCSGCGAIRLVAEVAKQAAASPSPGGSAASPSPDSPAASPAASTGNIDAGKWDGNTYTNYYTGLTYTLPDGWSRKSNEEMAEKNNGVSLAFGGAEYVDDMLDSNPVYLMYAERDPASYADLLMRRLSATEQTMDSNEFLKEMASDENYVSGSYIFENNGVLDMTTIGSEKYYVFTSQVFTMENGQKTAYAWSVTALRRLNDTLVKICAVAPTKEEAVSLLDCFKGDAAPETSAEPEKLDAGKWEGGDYTNDYLGVKFVPPPGWHRMSDEDMAKLNKGITLLLDGTGDAEAVLRQNGAVIVFAVDKKTPVSTGCIVVNKITDAERSLDDETFRQYMMEALNSDENPVEFESTTEILTLGGRKYQVVEGQGFEVDKDGNRQKNAWTFVAFTRTDDFVIEFECLSGTREGTREFIDCFFTTTGHGVGM